MTQAIKIRLVPEDHQCQIKHQAFYQEKHLILMSRKQVQGKVATQFK